VAPIPVVSQDGLPDRPLPGAVRIAAAQTDPRIGDARGNSAACVAVLDQARGLGAGVVVFTECALTGYCFADAAEARGAALVAGGPELTSVAGACAASGITAVVGYLERDGDALANTASVFGPRGELARYRKTHLPHLGVDRWVRAGCDPLTPVDADGLRIGVLICYDASFPEAARTLALRGADLIALPTNWPAEAVVKADWLPNTRAYENVVYFAAVNRVGEERGFQFHGRSRVCAPTGDTLVQGPADEPALLVADMFPERARTKRIERRGSEYWVDRIAHRRPDLYET